MNAQAIDSAFNDVMVGLSKLGTFVSQIGTNSQSYQKFLVAATAVTDLRRTLQEERPVGTTYFVKASERAMFITDPWDGESRIQKGERCERFSSPKGDLVVISPDVTEQLKRQCFRETRRILREKYAITGASSTRIARDVAEGMGLDYAIQKERRHASHYHPDVD